VQPQSAAGSDKADNLALACRTCNKRRGNRLDGRDPDIGEVVPFFNPPRDRWTEHFIWAVTRVRIVWQASTGWVEVELLDLNDDRHEGTVIRVRQRDMVDAYHPPSDDPVLSA
jgi:HNH endonuclease